MRPAMFGLPQIPIAKTQKHGRIPLGCENELKLFDGATHGYRPWPRVQRNPRVPALRAYTRGYRAMHPFGMQKHKRRGAVNNHPYETIYGRSPVVGGFDKVFQGRVGRCPTLIDLRAFARCWIVLQEVFQGQRPCID